MNSISLLLGRKQLWLIPSSSWRCPLSKWAKRHVCVWGDWKRRGGSSECFTHRECPHTYTPATYREHVDKRCGMVCTKLSGNKIQILPLPPHIFRYVLIQPSPWLMGCDLLTRLEITISMLMIKNYKGWLLGVRGALWDQWEGGNWHKSISREAVIKIIMLVIYTDGFFFHYKKRKKQLLEQGDWLTDPSEQVGNRWSGREQVFWLRQLESIQNPHRLQKNTSEYLITPDWLLFNRPQTLLWNISLCTILFNYS